MIPVVLEYKDNTYATISAEPSIRMELKSSLTFEAPDIKFHPMVRSGLWDGKIALYKGNAEIYLGLVPRVRQFCADRGYEVLVSSDIDKAFIDEELNASGFGLWASSLPLSAHGNDISPRPYQMSLAYKAVKYKRGIFKSATATGKSLSQYLICRHLIDVAKIPGKILLLVPTVALVEQMYTDFADYSSKDDSFYAHPIMSKIYSGKDKAHCNKICVSTWQSLQKIGKSTSSFPAEWFAQFDAVLVDETHTAESKEIKRILELCVNTEYRIGVSGTIKTNELSMATLEGLIGPLTVIQTTKQAMDAGHIAKLNIKSVVLDYRNRSNLPDISDYHDEIAFLTSDEARQKFIVKLALSLKGNTLIFFNLVEKHGRPLYELIKAAAGDTRNVYIVDGGVDVDDRERIRRIIETETNAIILASYGTSQTGTNFQNIQNGIFAAFSKSMVRVLQSIGRGLRKTSTKSEFTLFDIADQITEKNASYRHLSERLEMYEAEGFSYTRSRIALM